MSTPQRIPPRVVIGVVSGYLFCDSFDKALSLLWPMFGVTLKWINLLTYVPAPFIVFLAIMLAFGSRRAWILTQAYLLIRILLRVVTVAVAPTQLWQHYSSHGVSLPNGLSGPGAFAFVTMTGALNVLISIALLFLLRRHDVRSLFEIEQVEGC
jgi:hypothetical protein